MTKRFASLIATLLLCVACASQTTQRAAVAPTVESTTTTSSTTTTTAVAIPADNVPRPDPTLTPGAVFPDVTADQVCVTGYSTTVRNVPDTEKQQVFARYHIAFVAGAYEVDHLISLELGGNNDITNLWPEAYAGDQGARRKDVLENKLHALVCAHQLDLTDAQTAIASDWWAAYQQYEPMQARSAATNPSPTVTARSGSVHPSGTTGRCNDGSYTSAAHSQGACSHHGGLAEYWG